MRILLNEEPVPTITFNEVKLISVAERLVDTNRRPEEYEKLKKYNEDLHNFIVKINKEFYTLLKDYISNNNFASHGIFTVYVSIKRPKNWKDESKYASIFVGPLNYARTVVRSLFESGYDLPTFGRDGESLGGISCIIEEGDSWSMLINVERVGEHQCI